MESDQGLLPFSFEPDFAPGLQMGLTPLESWDRPLLFLAEDARGRSYIVVLLEESASEDLWLFAPMSPSTLLAVMSGTMEYRDAFTRSPDGWAYRVKASRTAGASGYWPLNVHELTDTMLPEPGFRRHVPDSVHVLEGEVTHGTWATLKFLFEKPTKHSLPMKLLASLLHSVQSLIDTAAHSLAGGETTRWAVPRPKSCQACRWTRRGSWVDPSASCCEQENRYSHPCSAKMRKHLWPRPFKLSQALFASGANQEAL